MRHCVAWEERQNFPPSSQNRQHSLRYTEDDPRRDRSLQIVAGVRGFSMEVPCNENLDSADDGIGVTDGLIGRLLFHVYYRTVM